MNLDQTTLLIVCGAISLVVGIAAGLISASIMAGSKSKRRIRKILNSAGKSGNLGDLADVVVKKIDENDNDHNEMDKAIGILAESSRRNLRNMGYVRYDSTPDISGNLSFSLILLDDDNNGLILTNIHLMEGSSLYLRIIENGTCEITLSPEEEELLKKTI